MRRSRSSLHEQSLDSLRGHIRQKTGADDGLKELLAQQHDTWRTPWQTGQQGPPSRLHRAASEPCSADAASAGSSVSGGVAGEPDLFPEYCSDQCRPAPRISPHQAACEASYSRSDSIAMGLPGLSRRCSASGPVPDTCVGGSGRIAGGPSGSDPGCEPLLGGCMLPAHFMPAHFLPKVEGWPLADELGLSLGLGLGLNGLSPLPPMGGGSSDILDCRQPATGQRPGSPVAAVRTTSAPALGAVAPGSSQRRSSVQRRAASARRPSSMAHSGCSTSSSSDGEGQEGGEEDDEDETEDEEQQRLVQRQRAQQRRRQQQAAQRAVLKVEQPDPGVMLAPGALQVGASPSRNARVTIGAPAVEQHSAEQRPERPRSTSAPAVRRSRSAAAGAAMPVPSTVHVSEEAVAQACATDPGRQQQHTPPHRNTRRRLCKYEGCTKQAKASVEGVFLYCKRHMGELGMRAPTTCKKCTVPGCQRFAKKSNTDGSWTLCTAHMKQQQQQGGDGPPASAAVAAEASGTAAAAVPGMPGVPQWEQPAAAGQAGGVAECTAGAAAADPATAAAQARKLRQQCQVPGCGKHAKRSLSGCCRFCKAHMKEQGLVPHDSHSRCQHPGCPRYAKASTEGVWKYCKAHMQQYGMWPRDYNRPRGAATAAAAKQQQQQQAAGAGVGQAGTALKQQQQQRGATGAMFGESAMAGAGVGVGMLPEDGGHASSTGGRSSPTHSLSGAQAPAGAVKLRSLSALLLLDPPILPDEPGGMLAWGDGAAPVAGAESMHTVAACPVAVKQVSRQLTAAVVGGISAAFMQQPRAASASEQHQAAVREPGQPPQQSRRRGQQREREQQREQQREREREQAAAVEQLVASTSAPMPCGQGQAAAHGFFAARTASTSLPGTSVTGSAAAAMAAAAAEAGPGGYQTQPLPSLSFHPMQQGSGWGLGSAPPPCNLLHVSSAPGSAAATPRLPSTPFSSAAPSQYFMLPSNPLDLSVGPMHAGQGQGPAPSSLAWPVPDLNSARSGMGTLSEEDIDLLLGYQLQQQPSLPALLQQQSMPPPASQMLQYQQQQQQQQQGLGSGRLSASGSFAAMDGAGALGGNALGASGNAACLGSGLLRLPSADAATAAAVAAAVAGVLPPSLGPLTGSGLLTQSSCPLGLGDADDAMGMDVAFGLDAGALLPSPLDPAPHLPHLPHLPHHLHLQSHQRQNSGLLGAPDTGCPSPMGQSMWLPSSSGQLQPLQRSLSTAELRSLLDFQGECFGTEWGQQHRSGSWLCGPTPMTLDGYLGVDLMVTGTAAGAAAATAGAGPVAGPGAAAAAAATAAGAAGAAGGGSAAKPCASGGNGGCGAAAGGGGGGGGGSGTLQRVLSCPVLSSLQDHLSPGAPSQGQAGSSRWSCGGPQGNAEGGVTSAGPGQGPHMVPLDSDWNDMSHFDQLPQIQQLPL